MASNLIVKISGDSKQLAAEYKKVAKQTEDLENQIGTATKAAAAGFIGFAGAIGLAASKAASLETIGVQFEVLTGSAEKGKKAVEDLTNFAAKTPFQFEGIAAAGQKLLGFQVQLEDLEPTLQRIGDVSAATGNDLGEMSLVFGKVKAAGKLTGETLLQFQEKAVPIGPALAKSMGVAEESIKDLVSKGQVDFATFEKAFASMSEKGGTAFEGMAKRSQTLEGVLSTLSDNFGLLAADIGKHFLPVLKVMAEGLTKLIQFLRDNPVFASMSAKVLALGAVMSGLVTVIGAGALAFFKIRAAILAANIATKTLSIGVKGLVGATGLGLLLIVASEIYANWDKIWPLMEGSVMGFADGTIKWFNVVKTAIASFLGVVKDFVVAYAMLWKSALTFDFDGIKENLNKLKDTLVNSASKISEDIQKEMEKQDKIIELKVETRRSEKAEKGGDAKDDSATKTVENEKKKTAAVDAETKKRIASLQNEQAILQAQADGASAKQIEFIKRRQELDDEAREIDQIKNEEERELALENMRIKEEELTTEKLEGVERRRELEAEIREGDLEIAEELDALDKENRTAKDAEELEALRASLLTKKEARDAVQRDKLKKDIATRNQFLKDEIKHGKAVANINKFLQSEEVKGVEQGTAQLVKLQNSKNNTLKGIGKAAAVTQITLDTAKGAMSAYSGFATIPIVGVALGIAAAAGVIAYGAEQIGSVLSANRGGMVPRNLGIPGQDSVSASLTPGELIVPEQNFDEVVNSVADSRRGNNDGGGTQGTAGAVGSSSVFNINGDVLADEVFIDRLIDGLNEAVEERNATLSATALV